MLKVLLVKYFLFLDQLIQENKSDPEISLHNLVHADPLTYPEYQTIDDLLLKNGKLLISSSSPLRNFQGGYSKGHTANATQQQ